MNTIKHTEYKHNGHRVILDTCELTPGKYETMLLYPNGHEIACRTARTEADAIADFDELLTAYPADTKPAAPKPLTGKYAKLRDDLRKVYEIGKAAAAQVEDAAPAILMRPQSCSRAGSPPRSSRLARKPDAAVLSGSALIGAGLSASASPAKPTSARPQPNP